MELAKIVKPSGRGFVECYDVEGFVELKQRGQFAICNNLSQ